MIHHKFFCAHEDKSMKSHDVNMPLVLLHPDENGDTALDMALKLQRPKSFELMIDILGNFENMFLSKMMLKSLPRMINMSTDMIIKYFSTCTYRSPLMKQAKLIEWPGDKDEWIFASHTSLISSDLIK